MIHVSTRTWRVVAGGIATGFMGVMFIVAGNASADPASPVPPAPAPPAVAAPEPPVTTTVQVPLPDPFALHQPPNDEPAVSEPTALPNR